MTRRTSSSAGRTHRRSVGLDPCTSAGGTRVHPARQLARSADGRPKAHDDIDPVVVPRFRHRLRLPSYCGLMCTPPRCPRRTDGTYQLGVAGRVRPGNRRIEHRQLGRTRPAFEDPEFRSEPSAARNSRTTCRPDTATTTEIPRTDNTAPGAVAKGYISTVASVVETSAST
jgi:hypothetical protein